MGVRVGLFAICLTGCQVLFPLDSAPAPDDALTDGPTGLCFGQDLVKICLTAPTDQVFDVPGTLKLDTETFPTCVPYSVLDGIDPDACVVAATTITITGTLRATGTRPLVLVASERIDVLGRIDVSSSLANGQGAGHSKLADCGMLGPADIGGGGAGGSFSGIGGSGGGTGATGGSPGATVNPTGLRGGCPGGNGAPNSELLFGQGGGAVALIAPAISISGAISASGSAGRGGDAVAGGGGGGGSGGMILLDGDVGNDDNAELFANGGGGGEGSEAAGSGMDGTESSGADTGGMGGTGGTASGGDGGAGSLGSDRNGVKGAEGGAGSGAGGGGGAAGVIRVVPAQALAGRVSPPPR